MPGCAYVLGLPGECGLIQLTPHSARALVSMALSNSSSVGSFSVISVRNQPHIIALRAERVDQLGWSLSLQHQYLRAGLAQLAQQFVQIGAGDLGRRFARVDNGPVHAQLVQRIWRTSYSAAHSASGADSRNAASSPKASSISRRAST